MAGNRIPPAVAVGLPETVRPPAGRRTDRVHEVRTNGRWYRAEASIRTP